jgi:hypothetical protein
MIYSQLATAVASVILSVSGTQALTPPVQPTAQVTVVSEVYPLDSKGVLIPWRDLLAKDTILYELASCESQFNPMARNDEDALITGFPSYGLLQYQPSTFVNGIKQYKLMPRSTTKEILGAINDPYLEIALARHMVSDGEGGQWSCYTIRNLATKYKLWKTNYALSLKVLD